MDSSYPGNTDDDPYGLKQFKIKGIGSFVGHTEDEREIYKPDEEEWPTNITLFDNQGRPIRG